MELKYVGPKAIITHTGITFDNNKEDKYVYLNILVQLLKSLNHKYIENKIYKYKPDMSRLSNTQLHDELKSFCPNIDKLIDETDHFAHDGMDDEIKRARENKILTDVDKETLENNIKIMTNYIVQRSINKRVYYCAVDVLAELVKKDNLEYIIVPMFQKFVHVLHSVQGSLKRQKFPIDTDMEIYEEDGQLLVKLKVVNILN
jgi:hypothetical protein